MLLQREVDEDIAAAEHAIALAAVGAIRPEVAGRGHRLFTTSCRVFRAVGVVIRVLAAVLALPVVCCAACIFSLKTALAWHLYRARLQKKYTSAGPRQAKPLERKII